MLKKVEFGQIMDLKARGAICICFSWGALGDPFRDLEKLLVGVATDGSAAGRLLLVLNNRTKCFRLAGDGEAACDHGEYRLAASQSGSQNGSQEAVSKCFKTLPKYCHRRWARPIVLCSTAASPGRRPFERCSSLSLFSQHFKGFMLP